MERRSIADFRSGYRVSNHLHRQYYGAGAISGVLIPDFAKFSWHQPWATAAARWVSSLLAITMKPPIAAAGWIQLEYI